MPRRSSNGTKINAEKTRKAATSKQGIVSRTKTDNGPKSSAQAVKASELVITEDEFRARVATKAHELYVQRQAMTEVHDWMQAERLVKEELLARADDARSV